ncbi:hypothetical protein EEL31_02810 [Brevibacillus laterosporus]|nr:hypothetical protein [Brevibacillus laterosporus]TPG73316.1 hypothetical protein EEL31_02810 [Brevibacillus laterosporus]
MKKSLLSTIAVLTLCVVASPSVFAAEASPSTVQLESKAQADQAQVTRLDVYFWDNNKIYYGETKIIYIYAIYSDGSRKDVSGDVNIVRFEGSTFNRKPGYSSWVEPYRTGVCYLEFEYKGIKKGHYYTVYSK